MRLDGRLGTDQLVASINGQLEPMQRCVALIRETDQVVGSLNLRLTVAPGGRVSSELQSPVNDQAGRCLDEGMRLWRVQGAGQGSAMLLLMLQDRPPPE